jgi:mRNA interferase YafQ
MFPGLTHSGRFNMNLLKEVMLFPIANDGPLPPPERLDHSLSGDWVDHN